MTRVTVSMCIRLADEQMIAAVKDGIAISEPVEKIHLMVKMSAAMEKSSAWEI